MGIPQAPTPAEQSASKAQAESQVPKDASQLPPEALALATKLFDYAREGATPALRQYVTAGIPVNMTNHKGDTLLMLASYHGHLETVQMLLEKGADVNALNERGQSIIAGAVFKGSDEIVKALLQHGADVNAGHPTAVDSAKMFKREECLRMFGVEAEA